MRNPDVFQINTTASTFTGWLEVYLTDRRDDPAQEVGWFGTLRFPLVGGHVHLNEVVCRADSNNPAVEEIVILGQYSTPDPHRARLRAWRESSSTPLSPAKPPSQPAAYRGWQVVTVYTASSERSASVLRFRMVPLDVNRTEVTAECLEQAIVSYYEALLQAIVRRWPEAGDRLQEHRARPKVSDTVRERAELERQVKDQNPQYSYRQVAARLNRTLPTERLSDLVPRGEFDEETVRNDWRRMRKEAGWPAFEKGERTR